MEQQVKGGPAGKQLNGPSSQLIRYRHRDGHHYLPGEYIGTQLWNQDRKATVGNQDLALTSGARSYVLVLWILWQLNRVIDDVIKVNPNEQRAGDLLFTGLDH